MIGGRAELVNFAISEVSAYLGGMRVEHDGDIMTKSEAYG